MSDKMDSALPYLWIIGMATLAIVNWDSPMAMIPAFVSGLWCGVVLADKFWGKS